MSDRRSQRIREQLRQHPNPRRRNESLSFSEQMRRVYLPSQAQPTSASDHHTQLARQLSRRSGRR